MARLPLDDQPPTPISEYGDIKESHPNQRKKTRRRTSLMPSTTRYTAVAAVYPGGQRLFRGLIRVSMGCFTHICPGGNSKTDDSPIHPGRKGKASASDNIPLRGVAFTDSKNLKELRLDAPPPMNKLWNKYLDDNLEAMKEAKKLPMAEKQAKYQETCQKLYERMVDTEKDKYGDLDTGITVTELAAERVVRVNEEKTGRDWTCPTGKVPSPTARGDGSIPIVKYTLAEESTEPSHVVVYYHGGGLLIGDAVSEQLPCRFILRHFKGSGIGSVAVYSVDYRLKTNDLADVCVHDSIDAYDHIRKTHDKAKFYIVGSSSGGELAAFVAQHVNIKAKAGGKTAKTSGLAGVVLRSPVTSDVFTSRDFVPDGLRDLHTTANKDFYTDQLGKMTRPVPRDGLKYMPLEAPKKALEDLPPHWIQISTNDALYSDGLCYTKLLRDNGSQAALQIVPGLVHTNWLLTPEWDESYEAEKQMIAGLQWLAGGEALEGWK
ncbi:atp synthase d chain [Ophiostoma piceae UAMH 11346]|uniref:Atp synthase d chain n=1 Tax=Ophiostoma piceae (strain UAMH 11346) TaxID=1262450 RepID=S3CG76_OPHP1|nr:atp synthase d chain [Ophiostoma piceae UAMH 11346]